MTGVETATGSGETICPQYNYGQGKGAWVPANGGPVYRKMEMARFDAAFALIFCMDILFGKKRSGNKCWHWAVMRETVPTADGGQIYRYSHAREYIKTVGESGEGWLYNKNTLNPSKTGVPRMFGPPATLDGGIWKYVIPCTTRSGTAWGKKLLPAGVPQFSFVTGTALEGEDVHYGRMLDAGHVAFSATDYQGITACVPYALETGDSNYQQWTPAKVRRGRPEAGDSKRSPVGRYYR